ncbi:MAG: hypothetical protein MUC69_04810 [Gemmatimonadales bacterium]|nr:hypothetical protein [Gemmatimonadales bacterium]
MASAPAAAPAARPLATALPVTGMGPSDAMPPFRLPGAHFAVALAWLGIGSACLTLLAPRLARGAWLGPEAAAVAHCFTLGWLVTSAYGTLYQLGPVAMAVEARSVPAGLVTLALHTAGVALVVLGLGGWVPGLIGAGWLLVVAGLALWTWNVGARLGATARAPRIGYTVLAAFAMLWLGIAVAGARIGNVLGWWMVPREALVAVHVQLSALGFGTLLVMGIGSRLLPMFLLSRTAPEWPVQWSAPLTAAGVLLQSAGWLGGGRALVAGGGLVAALGVGLLLLQAWYWYRHRARPQLDPSLRQVAVALAFLGAAAATGLAATFAGGSRLLAGYGLLLIVGWLGLLITAIYARIVPFLTWMHRYSGRVGEKGLPRVGDLVPVRWVRVASGAWMAGVATLSVGVLAGLPGLALAGAVCFAIGTTISLGLYTRLALHP